MMPVKSKEEKKKPTGNIRCSRCNYIMCLEGIDPVDEFVHKRPVTYTCPECGLHETLNGYAPLTRRCFDCQETAVGRFWMNRAGEDIFSCECPKGHIHFVFRSAFGKSAQYYDLRFQEVKL